MRLLSERAWCKGSLPDGDVLACIGGSVDGFGAGDGQAGVLNLETLPLLPFYGVGEFPDLRGKPADKGVFERETDGFLIVAFGEDADGELYYGVRNSGKIYKLFFDAPDSQMLLPLILKQLAE